MQLDLLNRWMLTVVPQNEGMKNSIDNAFKRFKGLPIETVCGGVNFLSESILGDDVERSSAAVNGLMLGMMLASASQTWEGQQLLEDYIKAVAKTKGENVINFRDAKVRLRR